MQTPLFTWQRILLTLGKLVLTFCLAVELALLFWRVVAPVPLYLMPPSNARSEAKVMGASSADFHLFGIVGNEPIAEVKAEDNAPDTILSLDLLGVTVAEKPERSSAIIAPKGAEGDYYRIGDTIQGSTRLAAVYDNRVVLDTNGKLEVLKFAEDEKVGISAVASAEPERQRGNLRERFKEVRTPTEFVNMLGDEARTDPQGALREFGLEAIGAGQGYRVQPGSMLMSLQLQPGDVVLSVNGQGLGDPSVDQQLLQQMSNESQVRIEVQRGNSRFVVNHSLN
ncbi:MAG: hypothetical protein RL217_1125 [Pseudomonadota bacterium]|jgi:general secretion pathway protein C